MWDHSRAPLKAEQVEVTTASLGLKYALCGCDRLGYRRPQPRLPLTGEVPKTCSSPSLSGHFFEETHPASEQHLRLHGIT